ncbi:hypothetical protein DRJ16_07475 [Candidatus Woesearchaeota archaeon]|nr:MAG: hypothetical protein DRJ16_07475 [Candidatus Woesearchaeota archaeon]
MIQMLRIEIREKWKLFPDEVENFIKYRALLFQTPAILEMNRDVIELSRKILETYGRRRVNLYAVNGISYRLSMDFKINETIKFECLMDGKCCRDYDVLLTPFDLERISNYLGIDKKDFFINYCTIDGVCLKLAKTDNGCVFQDREGKCKIYEAKPIACDIFPFGYISENRVEVRVCHGLFAGRSRMVGELLEEFDVLDKLDIKLYFNYKGEKYLENYTKYGLFPPNPVAIVRKLYGF